MKVAIVEAADQPMVVKEVTVPVPGDGEILVKIEMSGICHTDIHVEDGDWDIKPTLPRIPGHEGVGRVVKLGPNVDGLQEGDRVCVPFFAGACGRCDHCWEGWETTCDKRLFVGYFQDGCFAEFVTIKADFAGRVPDGLSMEQCAPITCAGITTYKGLKVTAVRPGQWVAVIGAGGGLGHLAVQYAKAMGMNVVAVDAGQEKAEFLKSLGADVVIDVKQGEMIEKIVKATGGGVHGAIIVADVRNAVNEALEYCRPRGVIVQISVVDGDVPLNVTLMVFKGITIRGSVVGTRLDLQESLELAAAGKVKCNVEVRGFSEVVHLMKELRSGKVKGRLVMDMSK